MGLSSKWWTTGKKKDEFAPAIKGAREVLDTITKILRKEHDELLKKQQSTALFDHAGWPYEQADANGYMRALRSVIELTDLTED